jgi:hypothetical protein
MKQKPKFWQRSGLYRNKRRPNFVGAFGKWAREHPDERARIEFRFRLEHPELKNT